MAEIQRQRLDLLIGQFPRTVGYGFRKGEEKLEENLRKACLVLVKDADTDWGFRILTSYPMFERQERLRDKENRNFLHSRPGQGKKCLI